MTRVIHFEIAADEPERARKFYSAVFGWKIESWGGPQIYLLITTGPDTEPGINGAIMRRNDPKVSTVNSIDVPSVDECMAKVTRQGGKVLTPKMPIPGVGYFAYCQDTEGNTFGIMQADKSVT